MSLKGQTYLGPRRGTHNLISRFEWLEDRDFFGIFSDGIELGFAAPRSGRWAQGS